MKTVNVSRFRGIKKLERFFRRFGGAEAPRGADRVWKFSPAQFLIKADAVSGPNSGETRVNLRGFCLDVLFNNGLVRNVRKWARHNFIFIPRINHLTYRACLQRVSLQSEGVLHSNGPSLRRCQSLRRRIRRILQHIMPK